MEDRKKILILAVPIAAIITLCYVKKYYNNEKSMRMAKDILSTMLAVTYVYVIYMMMTQKNIGTAFATYISSALGFGFLYLWMITPSPSTENYGGPIRNTRKIPMTDCYKFCDNNYKLCSQMYVGDNVGKCHAQWQSCRAECYFPNTQRMY